MQFGGNDHRGAFFIPVLVELLHQGMLVRVHCQHGKAHHQFACNWVCPPIPQASNAKGVRASQFDPPPHRPARLIAGLKEIVHQDQAELPFSPSGSVAGFFSGSFAAGVVGMAGNFVVFGPGGDQSKVGQAARDPSSLVAFHHQGRVKAWVGLCGNAVWKIDPKPILDPGSILGWREVGTHARSLQSRGEIILIAKIQP